MEIVQKQRSVKGLRQMWSPYKKKVGLARKDQGSFLHVWLVGFGYFVCKLPLTQWTQWSCRSYNIICSVGEFQLLPV